MAIEVQTTKYNVIYVLSRDADDMRGLLKIGMTSVQAERACDLEPNCKAMVDATWQRYPQATTLGISDMHVLHTEVACFANEEGKEMRFEDHDVHSVLENSGYHNVPLPSEGGGTATEWYSVDLDHAIKAIAAVKNGQSRIDGPKDYPLQHKAIQFRDEQKAAIEQTLAHFNDEGGTKMLWNAKMRFGKTLCALEVVRRLDFKRVMILTHRPTVRSGWFDDWHLIPFHNTLYGSKNGRPGNLINDKKADPDGYVQGKDLATMEEELAENGTHYIYFASMQDMRGKQKDADGNKIWKGNNKLVYQTPWDLIILDEAHEGTQTPLGKDVLADLCRDRQPLLLYLSGTPYNILSLFDEQEIYTWDYTMEQEAKERWPELHPGESNPYEGLAQLHIYTYDLADVYKNADYRRGDEQDDYFNFAEFFRTWSGDEQKDGQPMPAGVQAGHFVHEDDVRRFLDLLCCESPTSYYPFSNPQFRSALRHTLWMLPGVAAARRLTELILAHPLHTHHGFQVVNVAGEGNAIEEAKDDIRKIEKQEQDALKRVKSAVAQYSRTITLSCGRLTTGVSVPEWTGVFMLSGSYKTGAANYMQTIFRSQTPYKDGAIKANCYAFDFAPDRTLTVIDDYIKIQPRSRNTSSEPADTTRRVETTLHYLPVVAMAGGREVEYDAIQFIHEVNRAYSDHVVSNGFKSRHLFRNISTFSDADHALLAEIGRLLGGGRVAQNNDGTVVISANNLTDAHKGSASASKGKAKKAAPAPKPKPKEQTERADRNRQSQRVLDLIFVRMPLLLFGAADSADNLTLDDLLSDDFIDQESWEEFMPKHFTKATFRQIAHLMQLDVLVASTARIIQQAREADALPIEERTRRMADIVAHFRFPDKETVLTPWRVVNMHLSDTLGGYDFYDEQHAATVTEPRFVSRGSVTDEVLRPHDTRILEINSKSGVYPLWLAYNLWRLQRTDGMTPDDERRLWTSVLSRNLYVVCKTRMAEKITRRVLAGYDNGVHVNAVTFDRLIPRLKDTKRCNALVKKILSPLTYNNTTEQMKELKFNAVVGNPPYQVNDGGGTGSSAVPIYNEFVMLSKAIKPSYISLIMPAKWFSGGRGLDSFREEMLNDTHIKDLYDYADARDVFPAVAIAGGVCYFLWQAAYDGMCNVVNVRQGNRRTGMRYLNEFDDFIRDQHTLDIIKKVGATATGNSLAQKVYSRKPFGLRSFDKGSATPLQSARDVKLFGSDGITYLRYEDIPQNAELTSKWKVIMSKAASEHAGQTDKDGRKRIVSRLEVLPPETICTESYLLLDIFDTEEEANNLKKYIRTQLVRFLLASILITQNIVKDKFKFVPQQDFTPSSDIDWSGSVEEIDRQLYAKYGLSTDDIDFIKQTIKPME